MSLNSGIVLVVLKSDRIECGRKRLMKFSIKTCQRLYFRILLEPSLLTRQPHGSQQLRNRPLNTLAAFRPDIKKRNLEDWCDRSPEKSTHAFFFFHNCTDIRNTIRDIAQCNILERVDNRQELPLLLFDQT